jgi:hypothetical protein
MERIGNNKILFVCDEAKNNEENKRKGELV